jgi:alpha-L-fucosidase
MGYPPNSNLLEIFAYYYNKLPEGVVNDRWKQFLSNEKKFTKLIHCDFTTPEYSAVKRIKKEKWELCRGIGNSFGYNKFETEKDYLTSEQLIHLFIDVVSKNGNLLLNIGPKADGTIPEIQIKRLLDLGSWLEINGEAIFGTRVWTRAEGETIDGLSLRFTRKGDILYVILLGKPKNDEITIKNLRIEQDSKIYLLGVEDNLIWKQINDNLSFSLPEIVPKSHALTFKIIKN